MDDQHLAAALRLAALPAISNQAKCQILAQLQEPEALADLPQAIAEKIAGPASQALANWHAGFDEKHMAQRLGLLEQHQIHLLLHNDPAYPAQLKQLADAPPVLFYQGNPELLSGPQLAMVGSRRATPAGLKNAQAFAAEFADSGLTITSGLAAGIDTAAHRGALGRLGTTIAVVATGLDEVYPRSNISLARAIAENGCIISEFLPGTPARRAHFPQRNRLISGLALGVLVVEADTRSGSLITARLAGEQGREIFAIPGSIHSPTSRGCHQLIKQGAMLVETTSDVLSELKPYLESVLRNIETGHPEGNVTEDDLDKDLARVLNLVDFAPTRLEDIAAHSNLSIELVSSALLRLELAGRVSPLPGGQYQRIPG